MTTDPDPAARPKMRPFVPGPDFAVPDQVVDNMMRWFPPPGPDSWVNPDVAREAWRAHVRRVADGIWREAFHAGATYALAIKPARIVVTTEQLAEITERTGTT